MTLEAEIDLTGREGDSAVACDYVYEYVRGSKVLIASHEDMQDEDQTLRVPRIRTLATGVYAGTHEVQGMAHTLLKDTVSYTNLKPGKEYTLAGILMDKATGEPVISDDGPVTGKTVFTPAEKDGTAEVIFDFDGTDLAGKTVVVFERLLCEGTEVAAHADLDDEGQSVRIIGIRTNAVDAGTGKHKTELSHDVVFLDTVSYTGLTPGKNYTVCGTLMLKSSGKEVRQKGKPVTGMTQFIPEQPDGTVQVPFRVDTYLLQDPWPAGRWSPMCRSRSMRT